MVCGVPFSDAKGSMAPENVSPESVEMTQEQLLGSSHLMGPSGDDLPTLWHAISNSQSTSALEVADVKNGKVRLGQGCCSLDPAVLGGQMSLSWVLRPWTQTCSSPKPSRHFSAEL